MAYTKKKCVTNTLLLLWLCLGLLIPGTALGGYERPAFSNSIVENREGKAAPQAPLAYPPAFDWRNVGGYNYMTPVKNQTLHCASCTAFAVMAALEANARIRRNLPENVPDRGTVDFSEAQLFFCNHRDCKRGWVAYKALDYAREKGVIPESAQPYNLNSYCSYVPAEEGSMAECSNCCRANIEQYRAKGQVTQISNYSRIKIPGEMKQWLATKGPLVANVVVEYEAFRDYEKGSIYKCPEQLTMPLNHAVCCIGYDERKQAWLCKNSFGPDWGMEGYFWIGYGECGVDNMMFGIEGFTQIYSPLE